MNERSNVLVIEDDYMRIKWFKSNLEGKCNLDIFEQAEQGLKAVKEKKYDLIFLDHDLGGRVFVPSEDPNTGYQVAKILKQTVNRSTRVIVHSCNPQGADNMVSVIGDNSQKKEFGTFDVVFFDDKPIVETA